MVRTQIVHAKACPDENVLAAFLAAELAPAEASEVEAHLDVCPGCHGLAGAVADAYGRTSGTMSLKRAEDRDPNTQALSAMLLVRDAELAPGSRVGRYVVGERLGQGGMGVVYAAHDPDLGRAIALKVVAPNSFDRHARARLLREARAAARLQHANVVSIYDVGEIGDLAYFAMERIDGHSLRTRIEAGPVPMPERLRWLADVATALAAAHTHGLVHRDVKPDNVMVRSDGCIKVVDFGIARQVNADSRGSNGVARVTQEGAVIGTPQYMAPEQLRGEAVDPRTDQFAWGLVAYELLSGSHPWTLVPAAVPGSLPLQALPQLQGVPVGVDAVVRRALAMAPGARFATMADLHDAFCVACVARSRRAPTPRVRWLGASALVMVALGALAVSTRARVSAASPQPTVPVATKFEDSSASIAVHEAEVRIESLPPPPEPRTRRGRGSGVAHAAAPAPAANAARSPAVVSSAAIAGPSPEAEATRLLDRRK